MGLWISVMHLVRPCRLASLRALRWRRDARAAVDRRRARADRAGRERCPQTGLDIPANLQIFGKLDPNVRKPTAIVNGTVITGTDVDQRVALIVAANQSS